MGRNRRIEREREREVEIYEKGDRGKPIYITYPFFYKPRERDRDRERERERGRLYNLNEI